jgi:hypothetical protein
MNQITIRGIPADVERLILAESKQNNQSLNKTIISLLSSLTKTPIFKQEKKTPIGHDLDAYFGTWTREEADEFDAIIEEMFEQVDESDWK